MYNLVKVAYHKFILCLFIFTLNHLLAFDIPKYTKNGAETNFTQKLQVNLANKAMASNTH